MLYACMCTCVYVTFVTGFIDYLYYIGLHCRPYKYATLFWSITLTIVEQLLCFLYQQKQDRVLYSILNGVMMSWLHNTMTMVDCFLECIWRYQLLATFTGSAPLFVFSNSYWETSLAVLWQNIFYISVAFWLKFYLSIAALLNCKKQL